MNFRFCSILFILLLTISNGLFNTCAFSQDSPVKSPHYRQTAFINSEGESLDYHIMIPEGLRVDRKYPLVVALHGRGGKTFAAELLARDEMRSKYPCFVIAPVSGRKAVWAKPQSMDKEEWLALPQRLPDVIELIEGLIQSSPIDRNRVYITGQSMGGIGSFGAIASRPDLFAAAVPLCGGWDPDKASAMANVPTWIFHGAEDKVIPVRHSREMAEAMKAIGAPVKYTEFADTGHNIFSKSYSGNELWDWLFQQNKTSADPLQKWMEFMTPGKEHEFLKARVGRWKVETQQWLAPDQDPIETLMVTEYEMSLGGRYLIQKILPMDYNGMSFEARGFIGFDNGKKVFVSSWIDSFGTGIATGIGKRSEEGADRLPIVEWMWTMTDPETGNDMKMRAVETIISADQYRFDMFSILPDGTEMKSMVQIGRREKKE